MNYGIAETEIKQRLQTYFASQQLGGNPLTDSCEAFEMPESPDQYNQLVADLTKAKAIVQYSESTYGPVKAADVVVQDETMTFRILFEFKRMRGANGLYTIMEYTKKALLGWRLSSSDKMYISKYGLQQYQDGVFQPYLDFSCKTMLTQTIDESEPTLGDELKGLGFGTQYE